MRKAIPRDRASLVLCEWTILILSLSLCLGLSACLSLFPSPSPCHTLRKKTLKINKYTKVSVEMRKLQDSEEVTLGSVE